MTRGEENILVAKSLADDEAAYAGLIDAFSAPVFSLLLCLLGNHTDAEDVAQEVFIRAYKSLDTYNPQYPFLSWILRIAHNRSMDFIKSRKSEVVSIDNPEAPLDIEDPIQIIEQLESDFEAREIWRAVETLPPLYREAIMLRHQQNLDYSEMTVVMKLPLGTVKNILFRARQALKIMALSGKLKLFNPNDSISSVATG